jgi:hypothetical protein
MPPKKRKEKKRKEKENRPPIHPSFTYYSRKGMPADPSNHRTR